MYRALYRKWRPRAFDEVCGQEHITTVLKNQVLSSTVSHAYLFCGTHGTGKTTCAKILAKAVNCEAPTDGSPCGKCSSCIAIDSGTATDVLEIDAASNNGVDSIRAIRDEVVYPPSSLKKRVYIVDEVHMLTDSANNALLKTLEEPPEYVMFVLATTELQKIPSTIISRCQRFEFRRIDAEVIGDRVKHVCNEENIDIDEESVNLIARLSDGAMRDALSLLESCTAALGDGKIEYAATERQLGIANNEEVVSLLRYAAEGNVSEAMGILDKLYRNSRDLATLVGQLNYLTRDLMVIQSLPGIGLNKLGSSFCFSKSMFEELCSLAKQVTKEQLLYFFEVLSEAQSRLGYSAQNKKLVAEMAVIKLSTPLLVGGVDALRARVSALEAGVPVKPAQPKTTPVEKPKIAETPAPKAAPAEVKSTPFSKRAEFLESLSRKGAGTVYAFASTASFTLKDGTLCITPDSDIAEDKLSSPKALELITACAHEVMRAPTVVKIEKAPKTTVQTNMFFEELL